MDDDAIRAQALAARMFAAGLSAAELIAAYVGHRLGLYDALARGGPGTVHQIAERAGIATRYAREWLEQQAAAGIVEVDNPRRPPEDRLFVLPAGHAEALTDPDSPFNVTAMALLPIGGILAALPRLLDAYRSGGGVPYGDFGDEFRVGQASLNRPVFVHRLRDWIAIAAPKLHSRLLVRGGRIADLACGAGWSSIAMARAYPATTVSGFDADAASIELGRRNAATADVAGRVRFEIADAASAGAPAGYQLVCVFDALHDMARPVEVLRRCRSLVDLDGVVLVLEPRAAERFEAPATETERFLYAVSLLHCLPVGLSDPPSVACGAVVRPDTMKAWAAAAGFREVHETAVEHRLHRLYRLVP